MFLIERIFTMGQRLVIKNNINGETVNTIYYRWSAYTIPALSEIIRLRDKIKTYYDTNYNNHSFTDKFNLACLSAISGIDCDAPGTVQYIQTLTNENYTNNVNRNNGVIAFDKHGMANHLRWSGGTIEIDWNFRDGKPDMTHTTFNCWDLVFAEYEDVLSSRGYEYELARLKGDPRVILLEMISISRTEDLIQTLPYAWYDPIQHQIYRIIT